MKKKKKKVVSKKYSFKGWKFKEWLKGNWGTIKELVKVLTPSVLAWLATQDPIWTAVSTILGKLVLDTVEYYMSEQEE